jgi:hypothetical protein
MATKKTVAPLELNPHEGVFTRREAISTVEMSAARGSRCANRVVQSIYGSSQ